MFIFCLNRNYNNKKDFLDEFLEFCKNVDKFLVFLLGIIYIKGNISSGRIWGLGTLFMLDKIDEFGLGYLIFNSSVWKCIVYI